MKKPCVQLNSQYDINMWVEAYIAFVTIYLVKSYLYQRILVICNQLECYIF